ncbi:MULTISPECIES: thioredoxin domain-containing protein [Actinomadura]|uniref:Thioredoxin domain-containing protein n=1 Tax=Actinomadura litoris TaxID=2678616 RepID=A0A7K1L4H5_9ACTN|nr:MULTISPECIES: thioredoxin domain-containing protein [Actinomadura]MBT2209873.1 thioredoxin domain-containing protein [Actinomadura sp. NEAU-AAG7]MUN39299.1 thioredoxin domain-containing protein [Actinomadura litoris]
MSKAARERSAREKLAAERKRQAARQKQRRLLAIVVGAVVAVAVVVVAVVIVMDQRDKNGKAEVHQGALAPLSRDADGSIVMAKAGVTKPVLEIFEDFQCPICKQFEEKSGETVQQLAAEGKVKVVYRPFHLFGQMKDPIKINSLRSAEAALCVPADKWVSYHDALFKFQPNEGSKGFSPDDLVKWGKDVGVTDPNFEKCVRDEQKKAQVDQMTKYALETRKVEGTPTVFLDGKQLDLQSQLMNPGDLKAAIAQAGGGK